MQGLVLLPIHGCLGQSEIEHIINKTKPTLVFAATEYLPKIELAVAAASGGEVIAVYIASGMLPKADEGSTPSQAPTKENGVFKKLVSFEEVKVLGKRRGGSWR